MAIGIGAHTHTATGFAFVSPATSLTTTTGSTIWLGIAIYGGPGGGAFSSITDSKGNTYSLCGTEVTDAMGLGANLRFRRMRSENITGGSGHNIQVNVTNNSGITVWVVEVTGAATASFDQQAQQRDTSAVGNFTSGDTPTLAQAAELLIGFCIDDSSTSGDTFTAGNGFTKLDEETDGNSFITGCSAYKIVATTTGDHSDFVSVQATMMEVSVDTFKDATAPAAAAALSVVLGEVVVMGTTF